MDLSIKDRFKNAWNAFLSRSPTTQYQSIGSSYSYRPDKSRLRTIGDKTIISSIYNRIAMDVSAIDIRHVRLNEDGRFEEYISSGLDNCLTIEANIDQTGRSFIQDIVLSMLDEGVVAVVPVDTTSNPFTTNSYDILTLRVGKITQWYPSHVTVNVYDDRDGIKKDITLPKADVAIIENPLYAVMNGPNSTLQRLLRKLSLMDMIDEQNSSGKLDLIIQLPYVVRSDARRKQSEQRRKEVEDQLIGSKYGIAYVDSSEKITQLNRSVENNMMKQVEYLTNMMYSQLGITQEILNGTANEQAMLNYNSRTVEPIVAAIADELKRKFITKSARSQGQSVEYFKDPFRLVPVSQIADIADKFTRNEIMTSNELRQSIGMKPSKDPGADELRNKNLNKSDAEAGAENPLAAMGNENEEGMPNKAAVEGNEPTVTQEDGGAGMSIQERVENLESAIQSIAEYVMNDQKNQNG